MSISHFKQYEIFFQKKLDFLMSVWYHISCAEAVKLSKNIYALLAQLVEHLTLNQGVRGSSPRWRTKEKTS